MLHFTVTNTNLNISGYSGIAAFNATLENAAGPEAYFTFSAFASVMSSLLATSRFTVNSSSTSLLLYGVGVSDLDPLQYPSVCLGTFELAVQIYLYYTVGCLIPRLKADL